MQARLPRNPAQMDPMVDRPLPPQERILERAAMTSVWLTFRFAAPTISLPPTL
jgi:hypothetical protein